MKSEFTVKNLERKKEKTSIFIGSSFESLVIAEAVKNWFNLEKFEVDIWDEDIFDPNIPIPQSDYQVRERLKEKVIQHRKHLQETGYQLKTDRLSIDEFFPKNIDSLKKFTDIYDAAIFIFVPDDKLVSQSRTKTGTNEKLVGEGVRHNIVFEFGMFLGKIGSKKTFVLADQDTRDFIENFFTDLKDVKNYEYIGHYRQWINNELDTVLPYDEDSLKAQVQQIQADIDVAVNKVDLGFLPSTSLAIGFFENMMRLVVENLIRMKSGIEINAQSQRQQEEQKPITLEFPLQRSEIRFKLVIPHKLWHASHQAYQICVNHYGLIRVAIPTPTRAITVFCHPEVLKPNGRLIIYDIPSTLFSSWNAIDLLTNVEDIRQLLDEKEKRNFKKTVDHLLERHKGNTALAGIEHIVEVISIDKMADDFPDIEPFVMKEP